MTTFDAMQEMERLRNSLVTGGPRVMPMDVYREGDQYILTAEMPGVDPGSIDVDIDGQLLTIRAEKTLHNSGDAQWIIRERRSGSFLRQLTLGQGLDRDKIAATYDNGVLMVTIPVAEAAKPRKIAVATANDSTAVTADSNSDGQTVDVNA